MLARFALDPDVLSSAGMGAHKRLMREWMRYGVLCCNAGSFADSELAGILDELPQSVRTLWKKILKNAWLKPAPNGWSGLHGLEDHPNEASVLNGELELACLEATRLELVRDELLNVCPSVELGLFEDIDTSAAFVHSHELAEKRTDGIKVSDLWNERFSLAASLVKNITVVDRFALADGEGINGLEAFLVLLDGAGRKVNVTVYSSFGDEWLRLSESDAQSRVVAIRRRLARGGVGDIQLFLSDSRTFGHVEHDRFLKFDHLVFEIGSGMAIFNGSQSKQSTFSSKVEQDGHKKTVTDLRRLCSSAYPVLV